MNRIELQKKLRKVTADLLHEKGFFSPVDVFVQLGYLDPKDHEAWRLGRVRYLEAVIKCNLGRINFIMSTLRRISVERGLKPSWTAYRTWGKHKGRELRFSKSGATHLEQTYSTHFVRPAGKPSHAPAPDQPV